MDIESYTLNETRHTASKNLSTPISFTGMFQNIWPISRVAATTPGWRRALRYTGVVLLLVLGWMGTVLWYSLILSILFGVCWLIYTQARRHRIREARAVLATRAGLQPGSAAPELG